MMDRVESEVDLIIGIYKILQVFLQVQVPDMRCYIDVIVIGVDPDLVAVVAIDEGGVGKEPAVEDMVPAGGTGGITIIDAEGLAKTQVVTSKIAREIDMVLLADLIIRFYIEVIKIKAVAVDGGVAGQFQKNVGIGTPGADGVGPLLRWGLPH
jgi:hypothetical protein